MLPRFGAGQEHLPAPFARFVDRAAPLKPFHRSPFSGFG